MATKIIGATRPEAELSGPVSITGARSVLTAWRKASLTTPPSRPTRPRIDASGVASAMIRPATSTAPAAASAASPAATTPGTARCPTRSSESSPARGSTRPMRSRSGSPAARAACSARGGSGGGGSGGGAARARLGLACAELLAAGGSGGGGGSGSASRARSSSAAGGSGTAGGSAAGAGSLTRKSSWRAPQDGQKRERTLMRSPQLAQNLVSVPAISPPPPPCVRWPHGVVSLRGDGRRGSQAAHARRPLGRDERAALVATPASAQSPPAGTPKILLAFDVSGSMAADDGGGTPKIQAAQDAAVDLLGSLPPSTQVGLRVFGGTKPSRPIGPACRDSSLVLPIGPLDRSQAEQQIRSFKAKGRTPIAYALERAARGPRDLRAADDHPRLRRQGHVPTALAVRGRHRSLRAASRCASRRSASRSTRRRGAS